MTNEEYRFHFMWAPTVSRMLGVCSQIKDKVYISVFTRHIGLLYCKTLSTLNPLHPLMSEIIHWNILVLFITTTQPLIFLFFFCSCKLYTNIKEVCLFPHSFIAKHNAFCDKKKRLFVTNCLWWFYSQLRIKQNVFFSGKEMPQQIW